MNGNRGNPANEQAERVILGSVLLDCGSFFEAAQGVSERDFSLDSHRRLFRCFAAMMEAGRTVDTVTAVEELARRHEVGAVGGAAYVASLTEGMPRFRTIEPYVQIVRGKAMLRELIQACTDYAARADQQSEDAADLISALDQELLAIAASRGGAGDSLEQQCYNAMATLEMRRSGRSVACHPFGVGMLDLQIGGFGIGELTVLGGRPSMGKSSLIVQMVMQNCGVRRVPVHVFSMEMTAEQLLHRIYAALAGVPFRKVRHPEWMDDAELHRVRQAMLQVSTWPLVIDESSNLTADQLLSRARISKRRNGTAIVAIDYLQKLRFTRQLEHRHLDVTNAVVSLARMAKEEQMAVMLLSSLTEKSGRNRNDPPSLSDLRQSGDIAFEAHTVILIHRTIDEQSQQISAEAGLIIAKARSDKTGAVQARFNPNTLLFDDVEVRQYV